MSDILNTLLSIAMIFAPTLGYFDQVNTHSFVFIVITKQV